MVEPVVYWIDARDRLVRVNEAWTAFALANDAPELIAGRVIDRPLWEFVADETTRQLYAGLLPRVRGGATARFALRCDSPGARRRLVMRIAPAAGDLVEFEAVLVSVEPRPEQPLLRRDARHGDAVVTICGWCKRVSVGGDWAELEVAMTRLAPFDADHVPRLTHGICPACERQVRAAFEEAAPAIPLARAGPLRRD
jgi:hypothetical protein